MNANMYVILSMCREPPKQNIIESTQILCIFSNKSYSNAVLYLVLGMAGLLEFK